MPTRRRRLPHLYLQGAPLFLTWHLHGSIPAWLIPPPGSLASGEAFAWLDRAPAEITQGLDRARGQPQSWGEPASLFGRRNLTTIGSLTGGNSKRLALHRGQSGKGGLVNKSVGLSLVERGRRDESRRGTHECVRQV